MAKGRGKKKAKNISNVYSMFEQSQIQEFKEAFVRGFFQLVYTASCPGLPYILKIRHKDDLRSTYASLGIMSVDSEKLTMMMAEASGPINFTVFLEMLANKLHGTDPEDVIVDAFKLFDPENTGKIPKDYIGDLLCAQADRFTKEELEGMISAAPVDENLMVDYRGLAYIITHGVQEDEEEDEEEGESEDSEQTEE